MKQRLPVASVDDPSEELMKPYVPPGYRLTTGAWKRLIALAECQTRNARRVLLKQYDKHPIKTFERCSE